MLCITIFIQNLAILKLGKNKNKQTNKQKMMLILLPSDLQLSESSNFYFQMKIHYHMHILPIISKFFVIISLETLNRMRMQFFISKVEATEPHHGNQLIVLSRPFS